MIMASFMKFCVFLMFIMLSISPFGSSSSTCRPQINPFVYDLLLQCPTTVFSYSPIEMDGDSLDRLLSSSGQNAFTAILFYASWCPFSMNVLPKFSALSSMFPQIKHVMVEQSSALPSVFSRHGIHSVPSISIVNRTSRVRHHGPKDLHSLLHFYQRATGLNPVANLTEDQTTSSEHRPRVLHSWNKTSPKVIIASEPYLAFSLSFLLLKAFLYLCPDFTSYVISLWAAYIPGLNLAIFGESRQLLARALNLVGMKWAFSKSRSFHNRVVDLFGRDIFS